MTYFLCQTCKTFDFRHPGDTQMEVIFSSLKNRTLGKRGQQSTSNPNIYTHVFHKPLQSMSEYKAETQTLAEVYSSLSQAEKDFRGRISASSAQKAKYPLQSE